MASEVDICNMALSHIGSDAVVSSINPTDGTVESGYCARFYAIALGIMLERHPWSFAKTRQELAQLDNPSTVWQYAYAYPGNCLKPRRILQSSTLVSGGFYDFNSPLTVDEYQLFDEAGSADFSIETAQVGGAKLILTNEPEAVLLYIRRVEDSAVFSYAFADAFSVLLAGFLAGPIIKGQPGVNAGMQLRNMVLSRGGLLDQAAASDAASNKETLRHMPAHIRAR